MERRLPLPRIRACKQDTRPHPMRYEHHSDVCHYLTVSRLRPPPWSSPHARQHRHTAAGHPTFGSVRRECHLAPARREASDGRRGQPRLLIALSSLLFLVAVLVLLTSLGPIFYAQRVSVSGVNPSSS